VATLTELEGASGGCWTTSWWLAHCAGFHVYQRDEPVGYADEVVADDEEQIQALMVRVGDHVSHAVRVPVIEVLHVDPVAERVTLRSIPAGRDTHTSVRTPDTCGW
jgi:hypothetical protein